MFLSINAFCQNYYEMPYVGNRSKLTKLNSREMAEFIADNSIRQVFDIPKSGEKEHYGFF